MQAEAPCQGAAEATSLLSLVIGWLDDASCSCGGQETLLDFIAPPRDEHGHLIIPASRVTALAEVTDAWACKFSTLDGVSSAIP